MVGEETRSLKHTYAIMMVFGNRVCDILSHFAILVIWVTGQKQPIILHTFGCTKFLPS